MIQLLLEAGAEDRTFALRTVAYGASPITTPVLRRAIAAYLRSLERKPRTFRFDVVEVTLAPAAGAVPEILHFENVPLFPKHFRG